MILTFESWFPDEDLDAGEDPEGTFARVCWLPIVGPTGFVVWQTIARQLRGEEARLEGGRRMVAWDHEAMARAHGLKVGEGLHAPLRNSLSRLCRFELLRQVAMDPADHFAVRLSAPPLTEAQLDRSSPHVATLQRATFGESVAS